MFNEFCVTSIYTDLSQRKIVIDTNFKVDMESVSYKSVRLIDIQDGSLQNYILKVEDKQILLIFNEWPSLEATYHLTISGLVDVLKRTLNSPVDKEIVFVSDVKDKVEIVKPVHNEALIANPIEIEINAISEGEEGINYRYEISSDTAFFSIVESIVSTELKVSLKLKEGQYYVRARAEKQNSDNDNNNEVGDWSEPVSFVVITSMSNDTTNNNNEEEDNSDFLDDMLISNELFIDEIIETKIIEQTPNGTTQQEFYIVLNKDLDLGYTDDIDPSFGQSYQKLPNGLYIIDNITMYRRDF